MTAIAGLALYLGVMAVLCRAMGINDLGRDD